MSRARPLPRLCPAAAIQGVWLSWLVSYLMVAQDPQLVNPEGLHRRGGVANSPLLEGSPLQSFVWNYLVSGEIQLGAEGRVLQGDPDLP